jgi:hypothetical protein
MRNEARFCMSLRDLAEFKFVIREGEREGVGEGERETGGSFDKVVENIGT